jgi:hypothetical protein
MANHDVWDAIAQTDGTPAQSFEMLLDLQVNGAFHTTADIADLNPAFTAKTRARNTYASKGVDQALKYGDNLVLSWNHEPVRDANGIFQPDLDALLQAARKNGSENLMRLRCYDALGADYAFDGIFAISQTLSGTGWDDKRWYAITATQYKFLGWIDNPVLTGNVPTIESALPAGATNGSTVYVQGRGFSTVAEGTTGSVKFGANNAASFDVISDELIAAVVPATGAAGSAPIVIANPDGSSAAFPYTRGA